MNWDEYRREDWSIDLYDAWLGQLKKELDAGHVSMVRHFLENIEDKHPIRSRQVAALAIAQANLMAMQMDPRWSSAC